jgi:hypothetical protein
LLEDFARFRNSLQDFRLSRGLLFGLIEGLKGLFFDNTRSWSGAEA